MSEPTEVTSHVVDGLANLASQYRDATVIRHLLSALLTEVQELEAVQWSLYTRNVDDATGETLRMFGALVGLPAAEGFSDTLYRRRIKAETQVNVSDGTIADLVAILETLVGVAGSVTLFEIFPAQVQLEYDELAPSEAFRLILTPTLQRAASAGVLVGPIVEAAPALAGEAMFGWEDDPGAEGFWVGRFSTIAAGPRGDTFYFDLEEGHFDTSPPSTDI